jgi:phosphopantothenoylcysteine decarboxylase / phosphopantothenate---cysteine ligase
MGILADKHIVLGVTGSIACYKAADLASKLTQAGAQVETILTSGALQFISPLTFQSVTGQRAYIDADLWSSQGHVIHVSLGHHADLVVIAPATANTIARLAHGLADNLLSVTCLAARCPVIIAPAMDGGMFEHPATQANLDLLRSRGVIIAGPERGHLASGLRGVGRMLETPELIGLIRAVLGRGGPLAGFKVVVTAGGTQEAIDPVRVITNLSSGKQGFALAQAAVDLGASVVLICGPTSLPTPIGATRVDIRSALEMEHAVMAEVPHAQILVMAAAVADFRPAQTAPDKIKKEQGLSHIRLEKTTDILAAVAKQKKSSHRPQITVGFAAESQDLLDNARSKLTAKKLDFIVANDITADDAGFGVDTNRVTLLFADGSKEPLPLMNKGDVAESVMKRVAALITSDRSESA